MTTSTVIETNSLADTLALGQRLARDLAPGTVVALTGDLGAGKTSLVKGIALGLGIHEPVTSPTFTLIQEHPGGRVPLYHVDLYRLATANDALAIGIEEYLGGDGITVIEWAEKIESLLPPNARRIRCEFVNDNTRRFFLS